MKCPFCNNPDTQVVETRESEDGGFIRRRRRCGGCDKRFTTYERPEVSFPTVVKKDGAASSTNARSCWAPSRLRCASAR